MGINYYIRQFNETFSLKIAPILYDNDYQTDGVIEITLTSEQIEMLNKVFYYRKSDPCDAHDYEYFVESNNFDYIFNEDTIVSVPPPKNHTPCQDIAYGIIEQMAYDITGNVNDVASFQNYTELRGDVELAIKEMKESQKTSLKTQGKYTADRKYILKYPDPNNNDTSLTPIVHYLLEEYKRLGDENHFSQEYTSSWKAFQFHAGDTIAFNMKFVSPLDNFKLNDNVTIEKGTSLTYNVRLKIDQCLHNSVVNSGLYGEWGSKHT